METSRERVRKTINHIEPDVPAIDFAASTSSGISIFAYIALKERLGLDAGQDAKVSDLLLMLASASDSVLDYFGGDIVPLTRLAPQFGVKLADWKPWTLHTGARCLVPGGFDPRAEADGSLSVTDKSGTVLAKMPNKGFFFDSVHTPYKDIEEPEEIDEIPMAGISDEELAYLAAEGKRLYEETDKAVMFPFSGRIFEAGISGWGFEEFLVQLLTNEEMVRRYFERLVELHISDIDRILGRCNEYIDVFRFVDDLGSQSSLLMSPETYRKMVKPYHKKMFQHIKAKYPKQKIATHCCGSILPVIPDLIEAGVDILNPVQISAADMDPAELKRRFGDELVFWGGGANMQYTVPNSPPEVIREESERLTRVFMKGGGFLFNPVHNIQANVPPEKILAIYDPVLKMRA